MLVLINASSMQREFYIRGCLEIPVIGMGEVFMWGLWARISEAAFDEISDHWESQGREAMIGTLQGGFANSLSIYPDTLNQRLEVRISAVGSRPLFILEDAGNPLCLEQRSGLNPQRAAEYACLLLRMANG
jgi:hypothetical protein